jgi:2-polyprenyl-3-methyl-5-hydroxy-6-metoxy-1,4-benzoquinol methylase
MKVGRSSPQGLPYQERAMESQRSGAAVQTGNRRSGYYDQARPELAALVPATSRRVLDVGCGTGALGRLLKARGHYVAGVELHSEAAAEARKQLDEVITADVETARLPFASGAFDAIVLADILEHLVDPWRVLRQLVEVLPQDGLVVASIPNLQNWDVLRRLAVGRWEYRERGITDVGHLRFFTLQTIHQLFGQAGLAIIHTGFRYRDTTPRRLASWLTGGVARHYLARQYIVVGQKTAGMAAPLCRSA